MLKKLLNNKVFIVALGIIAVVGLVIISFNASKNANNPTPSASNSVPQPKVAKMPKPVQDHPVSGQIIVKFKSQYTDAQINAHLQQYHASIIKTIEGIDQTVVKVPNGQENTIEQELKNDPYVDTVQRDYTTHAFLTPDDPLFTVQYAFDNTGQSVLGKKGTPNDDINVEQAWNVTEGNGVKVAILDTGINLNQPDLAGKVILQKTFVTGTTSVEDGNGHGTHVAGILAADTNNNIGVAGTCPGCQLIIGKVLDDSGSGTTSDATDGITWAADNGAKVISMSLGTDDSSTASLYQQAVNYAMSKGAIVVAAAGNDGTSQPNYPAAATGVVAVAATTNTNAKASYSNFGSYVKIAAPGDNILSTGPTHSFQIEPFGYSTSSPYYYLSGTSMATPVVAGVAALVASTSFGTSPQAIINRIYSTADKISGTGTYWANGLVDAAAAVGTAPTTAPSLASGAITPTIFCVGGSGLPPCATINPNNPGQPTVANGNGNSNPSTSQTPGISGTTNQISGGVSPSAGVSGAPVSGAPISGTPSGTTPGTGGICANFSQLLNNLEPAQTGTNSKTHIKCEPSKGGNGGGGNGGGGNGGVNPNNGWLSQFIAFLIQLIMQILQLCGVQPPTTGTPTPSTAPGTSLAPSQSISAAPSSGSPSTGATQPTSSAGNPTSAPAPTGGSGTTATCTNPTQVLQMDPSDAQAGVTIGNFYLTNDTWNASGYSVSQSMSICSPSSWFATATMDNSKGDGAVKTYPNAHEDVNKSLSSFKTISSTFAESGPHVGIYEYTYDLWLNGFDNGSTEVMIWNDNFGQTPSGSKKGTFTDNGHTYDVYEDGNSYVAFVAQSNFTLGTVNILNFFNYLISQGVVKANPTVTQLDYGIEMVSTNGSAAKFYVNNFTLTTN
jgi:thermitase